MSDALATYLHDHLAGSHFAVKLLNSLNEQYRDEPLGAFALDFCKEVERDQQTLQEIIDHVGKASMDLAEVTGWLTEAASQFKLRRDKPGGGLGTFEALETLALGIRGKISLWNALSHIGKVDPRVPKKDFPALITRAQDQFSRAEEQRLNLVPATFTPPSG
jgi:hypothetical protein